MYRLLRDVLWSFVIKGSLGVLITSLFGVPIITYLTYGVLEWKYPEYWPLAGCTFVVSSVIFAFLTILKSLPAYLLVKRYGEKWGVDREMVIRAFTDLELDLHRAKDMSKEEFLEWYKKEDFLERNLFG